MIVFDMPVLLFISNITNMDYGYYSMHSISYVDNLRKKSMCLSSSWAASLMTTDAALFTFQNSIIWEALELPALWLQMLLCLLFKIPFAWADLELPPQSMTTDTALFTFQNSVCLSRSWIASHIQMLLCLLFNTSKLIIILLNCLFICIVIPSSPLRSIISLVLVCLHF